MAITAQRANIHGQVLSAEHNQSLPGAHLILTVTGSEGQPVERQTISSADGSYRFQDLPAGEARLQVSFVGYEPQRVVQEIRAGENRIDLVLIPRQVSLAQIVVTSLRKEKPLRESAMPFAVIREEEIEGLAGPTLSDMVTAQPGINLVRDGIWATSLNIRGLGENRSEEHTSELQSQQ